jgi:hypothetical protein
VASPPRLGASSGYTLSSAGWGTICHALFPRSQLALPLYSRSAPQPTHRPPEARRVAPAQARIVIKTRTCETKVELENICHVAKNCPEIGNCAKAYYRLLTCGHKWLDGAPRNGVPCERLCGKTPEAGDRQIAQDGGPFSLKSRQIGVRLCTPPV